MKFFKFPTFALILFSCAVYRPAIAITTPAEQDKLLVYTGVPKKPSDSLFSYTIEWRKDDAELYRSTGLSFLNAKKFAENGSEALVTKKILTGMKDALIQLDPNWRGLNISQVPDQPELILSNKAGYSFTYITVRDYTNQALRYELADKSFSSDKIQLAIDLVLAADVEYIDGFSAHRNAPELHGEIEISVDKHPPLQIKTDGKSIVQLEEEIAKQLAGAQISVQPLYPNLVSSDTRNNKPFDGSEVQLLNLPAKSIAIDIRDPQLGVLTKFKFPDENHTMQVVEPRFMLGVLGVVSLAVAGFFWLKNKKKV